MCSFFMIVKPKSPPAGTPCCAPVAPSTPSPSPLPQADNSACLSGLQFPPVVPMIDHEPGHAAIDADVFPCDEACLVGAEEEHHVRDVQGIAHPLDRLLDCVRPLVDAEGSVDPAGRDGIYPHLAREADSQRMGEGGDAPFGRRIAFRLRLAYAVAGRGDIVDASLTYFGNTS